MLSLRPLLLSTVLVFVLAAPGLGQITNVDDTTATPVADVGHDYIHMLSESVNPATGTVSLRIQLPTPKGRGMTLPFSIGYDSGSVNHIAAGEYPDPGMAWWSPNVGTLIQGGWSYGIPSASFTVTTPTEGSYPNYYTCTLQSNYEFRDPSGGLHSLPLQDAEGPNYLLSDCAESPFTYGGDPEFQATIPWAGPGSGSPPPPAPFTVTSHDGTVYYFNSVNGSYIQSGPAEDAYPPDYIQDRNGNRITSTWSGSGTSFQFNFTDMIGRTIISSNGFGPGGTRNTLRLGTLTYNVTWKTTSANYTPPSTYVGMTNGPGGANAWTCGNGVPANTLSQTVISSITLPNTESFTFYYGNDSTPHGAPTNPFGLLSEIDYPSGAWVQYTWALSTTMNEVADWPGGAWEGQGIPSPSSYYWIAVQDGCQYQYKTPVVTTRQVSFGGSSPVLTQNFSYSTNWASPLQGYVGSTDWTSKTSTVNTVDNVTGLTSKVVYTYGGFGQFSSGPSHRGTVEHSVAYYDSSSHLLRTVTKGWADPYTLFCQVNTLNDGNGQSSGLWYVYGTGYQVIDKRDYDYGLISASSCTGVLGSQSQEQSALPSAVPSRETVTSYQAFPTTAVGGKIYDRPSSVQVWANGTSGTLMSEKDYTYDNGTPSVGNPTKIVRRCLQSGSACAAGDLVTSYAYDSNGQITSKTDGRGNVTQYSYADSYSGCSGAAPPSSPSDAYLTQITYPSTNGVNHILQFCYGYDDGQLRSSTDENNLTTIYKYNDSLDRLTETDYSDGGETQIAYNDTPPNPTVTTTITMNASQSIVTTDVMDGAGHEIKRQLADPEGTINLGATVLDGVGRPYKVYNPTRCNPATTNCGESTWGYTTYAYDPLGRTASITKPDGSTVSTQYCGFETLVTDEAQHWRRSKTDAFGRLVEVDEPNTVGATVSACPGTGEPIWATSYTYDVLGNLTSVVQGGSRNRSFIYNSLGQLTQSFNPESGTTQYTYDPNGNVASRTAPAPNQTGGSTVTTSYTYDALNRVGQISYNDSPPTPTVTYSYDQPNCLGQAPCYNTGHRTSMTDAAGSEEWSYTFTHGVGWMTSQQRTTSGIPKSAVYSYDLAGNLTTLMYPSGKIALNYTYDSAGRPSTAQDALSGTYYVQGSCATGTSNNGVCYAPQGAISQMENGAKVFTTYLYNNRLQHCWIYATAGTPLPTNTSCTASDPGAGILDLQYNFNAGQDNGNVLGITNNKDTARSQTFAYDQVNRITAAQSSSTSGSNCWGETYSYDQWTNLQSIGIASGYSGCGQEGAWSTSANGNNQLPSVVTYDAAGNALGDNFNLYQWNAEGELKFAAGVNYAYDGTGDRVSKSTGETYWYGLGGEILDETDSQGNITDEYVFFGGKRIAHIEY